MPVDLQRLGTEWYGSKGPAFVRVMAMAEKRGTQRRELLQYDEGARTTQKSFDQPLACTNESGALRLPLQRLILFSDDSAEAPAELF